MKVQEAKRRIRLREWAEQINACKQSGLTVAQWCAKNGMSKKTYYNRMKRVREELLDAIETRNENEIAVSGGISGTSICIPERMGSQPPMKTTTPVFAALPIPQSKSASVTVWIGGYAVEIQNGADDAVVEHALTVVSRL